MPETLASARPRSSVALNFDGATDRTSRITVDVDPEVDNWRTGRRTRHRKVIDPPEVAELMTE